MAESLHWNDLKIGLIAGAAVVCAALAVLIFGRVGKLHGDTFKVYVTTDAARGVIRGTEVWLDGQKVGLVNGIAFQPPTVSTRERLVLGLTILQSAQQRVRHDTRVEVRTGGTLIGDQVVSLSSGTVKSRPVADGDTIHSALQLDVESMTGDAAEAAKQFPAIIQNVKLLAAQLKSVSGTLGALGAEQDMPGLTRVRLRTTDLLDRMSRPNGTIGLALNDRDLLMARAQHAMAQTDSIRALLNSNQHSLGRFRRDSTMMGTVTRLRRELSELQRLAASPNGTIGRLRGDSTIMHNIHLDLASVDSLIADMKKHPLRYNPF